MYAGIVKLEKFVAVENIVTGLIKSKQKLLRLVLESNSYKFSFRQADRAVANLNDLDRLLILYLFKLSLVNGTLALKIVVKAKYYTIFVVVWLPILQYSRNRQTFELYFLHLHKVAKFVNQNISHCESG